MADDDEGQALAKRLRELWDKGDRALMVQRRNYWLNLSFFFGEQWVYFHKGSRELAEFPRAKDNPDRVRLTINRMKPNLINALSKLMKRELAFEVMPSAVSDDIIGGARLGETVLAAAHTDLGWESVRYEELFAAFLGATSAVAVEWDGSAGAELEVDPDSGAVVGTGECKLTPLSILEFTLEPGSRSAADSRWWQMARSLPPDQVQEKYRLKDKPKADSGGTSSPMQRKLLEERGFEAGVDLCTVYTYYERPTSKSKGRMVTLVGDEVVDDRPWPFPFKRLNIETFRCIEVPMRWHGDTYVNDARPIQAAYNAARSTMSEHMKVAANARLAVPDTAMDLYDDLTDLPGEKIPFDGTTGHKPTWLEPPHIDRWIIQEADRLSAELDDIMQVHDISRGESPGDRIAGIAVSQLMEADETPLGLMAKDQARGWAAIAKMVLELYAAKVSETRTALIGADAGEVPVTREWTGALLREQTRVKVPLDNVLPTSRAALQAFIMQMATALPSFGATLSGPMLAKMLDLPGTSMLKDIVDADVAKVARVIHQLTAGRVVLPEQFDDHAKHIAELNRFRKSASYEFGSPETRELTDLLVLAHQRMGEEEALAQRQANMVIPGSAALPQAHEPPGSAVPTDHEEQQTAAPAAGAQLALPAGAPA